MAWVVDTCLVIDVAEADPTSEAWSMTRNPSSCAFSMNGRAFSFGE